MKEFVILAHNYVRPEVQRMADFVGDSLELVRKVKEVEVEYIVFAGVDFMAEMAVILNPDKKVIHPDPCSKCAMAARVKAQDILKAKGKYPDAEVVTYVNSSAEVKAVSDVTCTSANAVKIAKSMKSDRIIFAPDKNLAHYVAMQTDKEIIPVAENGCCPVHHALSAEDVARNLEKHPEGEVIVHPECTPEVIKLADFVGSTSALIRHIKETSAKTIIVGTEIGIISRMKRESPEKNIVPASKYLVCPDMKMITVEKLARAIEQKGPIVHVNEGVCEGARRALEKMIELSPPA
ncbi:MAG TPA: quinolinate synthase NadA [Proteobacteria bacterium]|nr:quinolinate synthase NadA [Pseudomonadota bacterium]